MKILKNTCSFFLNITIIVFSLILFTQINAFSASKLLSPSSNDTLIVGKICHFEWTNDNNAISDLYYSTDNGNSWLLLSGNNTSKYYDWIVPSLDSLNLIFRLDSKLFVPPYLLWEYNNLHNGEIRTAFLYNDDKYIVTCGKDSKVKLVDVQTKKIIDSVYLSNGNAIYYANYFHSLDTLVLAIDSSAAIWDRVNNNAIHYYSKSFKNIVRSCDIHPSRQLFAAASYDGSCKIISNDGTLITEIKDTNNSEIYYVKFSHDGTKLALGTYSGDIYLYDWENNKLLNVFGKHGFMGMNTPIWSLDFSKNDSIIVSGGVDMTLRLWDIQNNKIIDTIYGNEGYVRAVACHPKMNLILSGSLDSTLRQWYASDGIEISNARINHGGQVITAGYSSTGDTIISAGRDGAVRLWHNFQNLEYFDTVRCIVRYPLIVNIPHLTSKIDNYIKIPILTQKTQETNYIQSKKYNISFKIEIPKKILAILDNVITTNSSTRKDTLSIEYKNKNISDTLINLKGLVLFGDVYYEEIRILDFELTTNDVYKIETDDGSLTIVPECNGETNRTLVINSKPFMVNINPNPVTDILKFNLNLIEDGFYELNIYNLSGYLIGTILEKDLKAGEIFFDYKINDLLNGTYFVNLKTPSGEIINKSFIIKR